MRASTIITIAMVIFTLVLAFAAAAPTLERLSVYDLIRDAIFPVSESPELEAEPSTEPEAEAKADAESEPEPEPESAPEVEPEPEPEAETDGEPDAEPSPSTALPSPTPVDLAEAVILSIPNTLAPIGSASEQLLYEFCVLHGIPAPVRGSDFLLLTMSGRQRSELKFAFSDKIMAAMVAFEANSEQNSDLSSIRCNSDYTILSVIPKSESAPMDASRFHSEEFTSLCLMYQSINGVTAPVLKINFINAAGKVIASGQYPSE